MSRKKQDLHVHLKTKDEWEKFLELDGLKGASRV